MLFKKASDRPANDADAQRCVDTLYELRKLSAAAFSLVPRIDESPRALKKELRELGGGKPGEGMSAWEALALQRAIGADPAADAGALAQNLRMCSSLHDLYGAATFQLGYGKALELPDPHAPRPPFDTAVFDQQRPWDADRCAKLLERIDVSNARTALDLGCGSGASTRALLGANPQLHVVCVDFSETLLEQAKRDLAGQNVEFVLADLAEMRHGACPPVSKGPFDLVISNAALNFVPNERALSPLIWQACAPGGTVAIQQEAHTAFADLHHFLQLAIHDLELESFFTPEGAEEPVYPDSHLARMLVRNSLRDAGFVNVTAQKLLDDPLPDDVLVERFREDHLPYYLQKLYDLDDYDSVCEKLLAQFDNVREQAGHYRKSPGALYLTAEKPL